VDLRAGVPNAGSQIRCGIRPAISIRVTCPRHLVFFTGSPSVPLRYTLGCHDTPCGLTALDCIPPAKLSFLPGAIPSFTLHLKSPFLPHKDFHARFSW
jgi:hypothetical protein